MSAMSLTFCAATSSYFVWSCWSFLSRLYVDSSCIFKKLCSTFSLFVMLAVSWSSLSISSAAASSSKSILGCSSYTSFSFSTICSFLSPWFRYCWMLNCNCFYFRLAFIIFILKVYLWVWLCFLSSCSVSSRILAFSLCFWYLKSDSS